MLCFMFYDNWNCVHDVVTERPTSFFWVEHKFPGRIISSVLYKIVLQIMSARTAVGLCWQIISLTGV